MKSDSCIPPTPLEPAAIDVRQVAELLTVSSRTVERMIALGEFPQGFTMAGRTRRWSKAAVLAWIESRHAEANKPSAPHATC